MNSRKTVLVACVLAVVGVLSLLSVSAQRQARWQDPFANGLQNDRLPKLYPLPEFELIESTLRTVLTDASAEWSRR